MTSIAASKKRRPNADTCAAAWAQSISEKPCHAMTAAKSPASVKVRNASGLQGRELFWYALSQFPASISTGSDPGADLGHASGS